MPFNLPIFLTWLRIVLIPLMVAVYYVPEPWIHATGRDLAATIIFVIAAVTDWLDGYLARKWNETSAFGAFLDPVADKLMVAAALIILVWLDRVGAILAIVIIGREITISALREWMAEMGARKSVAVSMIGKDDGTNGVDSAMPVSRADRKFQYAISRHLVNVCCCCSDIVVDDLLPTHGLAASQGEERRTLKLARVP